jgi:hypothetical protein
MEADHRTLLPVTSVSLHHLVGAWEPLPPVGFDEATALILVQIGLDNADPEDRVGLDDAGHAAARYLFAPKRRTKSLTV